MLPTFIIIGAMKGGTTSLYYYLKEHPDICMSRIKEPDYFIGEGGYRNGVGWYEAQFIGEAKAYGEASPSYSKAHLFDHVPRRMHRLLPEVKLIYLVRDPIRRIISHYLHNCRYGRETRSLPEALKRLDDNTYILTSRYHYQLSRFHEYYPQQRILMIASEDLLDERETTLRKIFAFLGVDANFTSEAFKKLHHVSPWKEGGLSGVLSQSNREDGVALKTTASPDTVAEASSAGMVELDSILREKIEAQLRDDVEQLRKISGDRFDKWSL